jgi:hypothetical protein
MKSIISESRRTDISAHGDHLACGAELPKNE